MKTKTENISSLLLIILLASSTLTKGQQINSYTKYVNTFIGTAPLNDPKILGYELPKGWRSWAGLTFPGSSLPNAMVQLSPMTAYGSGAGYQYEDSIILGFTHTNKGHWNLCNIPILPLYKSRHYIRFSYISDPDIPNPKVETKAKAGVSKTLEYSYDDYSVAQIAKKLCDTANYRILMARSKNYKNMFDPSTRFMRGRLENGDWIKPFNRSFLTTNICTGKQMPGRHLSLPRMICPA